MLDNRGLVKKRLGELGLGPRREEEILRELGEHLEDHAAALEARGLTQGEALREALNSVSDWPALRSEIILAETDEATMNHRTKVLWLPALCTLTLTNALLPVLHFAGFLPHFYWLGRGMGMGPFFTFYAPWLVALPFIGAGAAFWSQRAGGGVPHRLVAALAPAIIWLGFLLIGLPISLVVDGGLPLSLRARACAAYLVSWVLLPAIPLLLGAAPFLQKPQPQT
jgi:hypothetical protein